jgi:hypothetical protein
MTMESLKKLASACVLRVSARGGFPGLRPNRVTRVRGAGIRE